jgi:uncharacterized membrane protein YdjX (TVP38/TMEM64 family)
MKPSESPLDPKAKLRRWFQLGVFGVILTGLIVAGIVWGPFLWQLLSDKEKFKEWIESYGDHAAPVFMMVQFVQVVIFFIPGEFTQVAGGFIFGQWKGLLYSYIGITAGAVTAFYLARWFEKIVLDLLVDRQTLKQFDQFVYGKAGVVPIFILFFIPAIPKDLLCYICGLTPMHALVFLGISTLGRFPGILMSSIFGEALQERNWVLGGAVAAASVVPAVLVYIFRGPIERFRKKYLTTAEELELLGADDGKPDAGKPRADNPRSGSPTPSADADAPPPAAATAGDGQPPVPSVGAPAKADPNAEKAAPMDRDSV